ncbi:MAG TPA: pyridoxamine 5'-phosphate oxidase family protein [Acidimicrobiales bacterium]|nr:pyridoxamine 5'-phosphate oxidase family protein [Acidimicrobiales bacterium]
MPRQDVQAFLERPLTAHLATVGPNVRPVWFLWEDGAFWVISGPWSKASGEIQRDPHVILSVDVCNLYTGETKQISARGEAELLPWDQQRAWRLLRRYLGDDANGWDDRFRAYMRGGPGCVWIRLEAQEPRLNDLSFVPSDRT